MKIDYLANPLAIVKLFKIPYAGGEYHLHGRIRGIIEEGFDEVGWFEIDVRYPPFIEGSEHSPRMGGNLNNYRELKKTFPNLAEAEGRLRDWCKGPDTCLDIIELGEEEIERLNWPNGRPKLVA